MTTYRLTSDPMVHMPGIIAWAINGYHFEKDRPQLAKVIEAACPDLPTEHIHGLLTGTIPHRIEGDTVIVTVPDK